MEKLALLYLVHRIPYPPNKGDKVRSFNLLKHLSGRYRVFLGTFIDDADDWQHVAALGEYCAGVQVLGLSPRVARLRALAGLWRRQALSLPYYSDGRMQRWVDDIVVKEGIRHALVYSSSMAQYVEHLSQMRCVVDFVDVDSAKWSRYADDHGGILAWLYRREGRQLAAYEQATALRATASVLVSQAEADTLREMVPTVRDRIHGISNGVDADYFSPAHSLPNPYAAGTRTVVFTGAMDYWPNVDAVCWFANAVWPRLHARYPDAGFYIVGMNPVTAVNALAAREGVFVTGRVPDVRPWLAHATAVVAPLRVARGIQNKVLEAMSMARPVVASPAATIGIDVHDREHLLVAEGAEDIYLQLDRLLRGFEPELGARARHRVLEAYDWRRHLAHFDVLIEGAQAAMPQVCESV